MTFDANNVSSSKKGVDFVELLFTLIGSERLQINGEQYNMQQHVQDHS